jgi:dynein heavy chain 2
MRELVRKRVALGKWKTSVGGGGGRAGGGGSANLLANPLALGDLFHPRTFINALRQQTARQLGVAIDMVKMICSWDKDGKRIRADCPLVCVLSSLLLQGANFHSGSLQESAPEASEMIPTPEVSIGFVPLKAPETYSATHSVPIPVYLSPSREELLTELTMPISSQDPGKWILSGVALFLNEEE